ncbi:hypothetical protein CEUSTIGMA_g4274.t1 [Chlamydomonas eustigma]|uniref:Nucleotide-diphospho-sugar transferase domain-containing protein n=1 Tax=Chlamydomonas eustigma TaxID=1157962 RepID=A0A250X175_9CHLO|nr:hypothetical protein CEUSTIGMA_g4274.t1 [Chlamydomonas eustigma]|eukprot:GAX76828.1 hypothetical protein CEUSTIGMA_g4274.t1 [Chlamydomonas eustigma]
MNLGLIAFICLILFSLTEAQGKLVECLLNNSFCSKGILSGRFVGDIRSSSGLRAALDATSYQNEVIITLTSKSYERHVIQLRLDLLSLGIEHLMVLAPDEAECESYLAEVTKASSNRGKKEGLPKSFKGLNSWWRWWNSMETWDVKGIWSRARGSKKQEVARSRPSPSSEASPHHNLIAASSCAWDSSPLHPRSFFIHSGPRMWHHRWRTVARSVHMGFNVMTLDSDMIVLRNPYPLLKSPPFSNAVMLVVDEGPCYVNGGWMYIQGARSAGPTAWVLAQSVDIPLRWMDDEFTFLQSQGVMKYNSLQMCSTLDQALIADPLRSAMSGRISYGMAVAMCRSEDLSSMAASSSASHTENNQAEALNTTPSALEEGDRSESPPVQMTTSEAYLQYLRQLNCSALETSFHAPPPIDWWFSQGNRGKPSREASQKWVGSSGEPLLLLDSYMTTGRVATLIVPRESSEPGQLECMSRFYPEKRGDYSLVFWKQLEEDCQDCPLLPDSDGTLYKTEGMSHESDEFNLQSEGKQRLLSLLDMSGQASTTNERLDAHVATSSVSGNIGNDDRVLPRLSDKLLTETLMYVPPYVVASGINVNNGLASPLTDTEGPHQVFVHSHFYGHLMRATPSSKMAIRKVLGRYHWGRSGSPHHEYQSGRRPQRLLALSPDIDLSLTRNATEYSIVLLGLIQVAAAMGRAFVLPDLPCHTTWLHRHPEEAVQTCQVTETAQVASELPEKVPPMHLVDGAIPYAYPYRLSIIDEEHLDLPGEMGREARRELLSDKTVHEFSSLLTGFSALTGSGSRLRGKTALAGLDISVQGVHKQRLLGVETSSAGTTTQPEHVGALRRSYRVSLIPGWDDACMRGVSPLTGQDGRSDVAAAAAVRDILLPVEGILEAEFFQNWLPNMVPDLLVASSNTLTSSSERDAMISSQAYQRLTILKLGSPKAGDLRREQIPRMQHHAQSSLLDSLVLLDVGGIISRDGKIMDSGLSAGKDDPILFLGHPVLLTTTQKEPRGHGTVGGAEKLRVWELDDKYTMRHRIAHERSGPFSDVVSVGEELKVDPVGISKKLVSSRDMGIDELDVLSDGRKRDIDFWNINETQRRSFASGQDKTREESSLSPLVRFMSECRVLHEDTLKAGSKPLLGAGLTVNHVGSPGVIKGGDLYFVVDVKLAGKEPRG